MAFVVLGDIERRVWIERAFKISSKSLSLVCLTSTVFSYGRHLTLTHEAAAHIPGRA